jgi:hypothetical protein
MEDQMTKAEYSGWYNYETWNCALWIGNDQGTDSDARMIVEDNGKDGIEDGSTASSLKEWVEENMLPDLGASFASDILGAAVEEINFQEIVENFASDIKWPEDEEEEE